MDAYTQWLKNTGQELFEGGRTYWRLYQKALIPASLKPEPIDIDPQQVRELLDKSGALFLRYFSRTYEHPTNFWYTACDNYEFTSLPRKLRYQIRRASKDCRVERIDPCWLADHGYGCYTAAFARYQNAKPESKAAFDDMCRGAANGPFEFWGVFVGNKLAGFNKYAVGEDYAASVVLKLDPEYLSLNPASVLEDTILATYAAGQRKTVVIGFRSLVHDTNMHEFLLKFGYRRVYCDLKLAYKPLVRPVVDLSYSFRSLMSHMPYLKTNNKVGALLLQEEISRSFEHDGKRTIRSNEPILYRIVRSIWGNRYGTTVK